MLWRHTHREALVRILALVLMCSTGACLSSGSTTKQPVAGPVTIPITCRNVNTGQWTSPIGTAFFVNRSGDIITAFHVAVGGVDYVKAGYTCLPGVVIGTTFIPITGCTHNHHDVADCALAENPFLYAPNIQVLTTDTAALKHATKATIFGYPLGSWAMKSYQVSFLRRDCNKVSGCDMVFAGEGKEGYSGGPIVLQNSDVVVGMAGAITKGVTLARPAKDILDVEGMQKVYWINPTQPGD